MESARVPLFVLSWHQDDFSGCPTIAATQAGILQPETQVELQESHNSTQSLQAWQDNYWFLSQQTSETYQYLLYCWDAPK